MFDNKKGDEDEVGLSPIIIIIAVIVFLILAVFIVLKILGKG
jgi:flagellar basal body-associated protein FliL